MAINSIQTDSDLSINIGKLKLKAPVIGASGTFGYADEYSEFINLDKIGAVVTKGITLNPRCGNPQPRLKEVNNGLINSIGLENIGINEFINIKLPVLEAEKIDFILNIGGFSIDEYLQIAEMAENNGIKAIELNLSCPNIGSGCIEFSSDPEVLYKLVSSVRNVFSGTLIVKLGIHTNNPAILAKKCQLAGAEAISAINTVKAMSYNLEFKNNIIIKNSIKGGLSGPCIKPIALHFINTITKEIDIPVIGMGGITTLNDALEFFAAGANAIQIGTGNFANPKIAEQIVNDLRDFLVQNRFNSFQKFIEGVKDANN